MKKFSYLSFLVILIFVSGSLIAQDGDLNFQDRIRAEKVSFITEKLELTPSEAQKFWPLYNEMEKNRWEAQKARRDLELKVHEVEEKNLSKGEITQLTRDYSSSMEKEGELYVKYNEEFLKILSPVKVLKLYRSENDFRIYMIRKYRDRGREGRNNQ